MSSSPVTEFVTFPATDALKANPELFREAVQIIGGKNVPAGMLDQAWGFELKEPEIWHGFLTWPTLEHHLKVEPILRADKDIQNLFQRFVEGAPPVVTHVAFSPFDNYKRCMAAPLTEVVLIKVKDGADIQEFKAASENGLDKAGAAEGCIRGAWGFTVEDEKMIVMVMGWESNEAYLKYEDSETLKNVIIRYEKVAELVKLSHVRLTLK